MKTKYKILVVDDEPDQTLACKVILEDRGYQVTTFNNPLIALSSYRPDLYDLLLLNVNMPYMNGFELCKEIRKIDNEVKICFVTSQIRCALLLKNESPVIEKCCFIQKPIENKELIKIINRELGCNDDTGNNSKCNYNDFSLDPAEATAEAEAEASIKKSKMTIIIMIEKVIAMTIKIAMITYVFLFTLLLSGSFQ